MGKYGMSETDVVRDSLAPFCTGMGIDIGFGGSSITPNAINLDTPQPYVSYDDDPQHLSGDGRNLYWFRDEVLDYVYSSHLLEDFPPSETSGIVEEWLRVLRVGGHLVLCLPNEPRFREHCDRTGQPYNPAHTNHVLDLEWFTKNIVSRLDGVEIVHENPKSGAYSFEVVLRKVASTEDAPSGGEGGSTDWGSRSGRPTSRWRLWKRR